MGAPGDGLPEWGPTIKRRSGWGHSIREGSLIMGRGSASEVLPLQKKGRGAGKVFAILNWGHNKFGVVLTQVLEVLTILEGDHKRFPPFKRG